MSRKELLELLVLQSKKNDELTEKLYEANLQLENREINISNAGSIAEASLILNEVFEKAQQAADQYLENIIKLEEKNKKLNLKLEQKNKKKTTKKKPDKSSTTKKKNSIKIEL